MKARRQPNSTWIWLLCIALLVVRMGGAHWHLCYDGMEPPHAVHAGDGDFDDGTDQPGRSDANLNLVDSVFFKSIDNTIDLPALLLGIAWLFAFIVRTGTFSPPFYPSFLPISPHLSSAQPRAPPR